VTPRTSPILAERQLLVVVEGDDELLALEQLHPSASRPGREQLLRV